MSEGLNGVGLSEILKFFESVVNEHFEQVVEALSASIPGMAWVADHHDLLAAAHRERNINFRLCDYTPSTADPGSENCGAHRDYGTFSIIFLDDTPILEIDDESYPGGSVPGDATDCWLAGARIYCLEGSCAPCGTVSDRRQV